MKDILAVTKALADESRLRALMALSGGELCLCQIISVLELAPATVSKHMSLLYAAGLVERRKEGKWHYYRLPGREASPAARQALRWVTEHLEGSKVIAADVRKCCAARAADPEDLTGCYCGTT
ncbi:MAG: winged helix-turn-helix transcriptional regulator [Phycisphaeraceae bacterium]|nr:winged helix-turn-helix transcriptional regulator [Phycisphaeraceae bacterium]